MHAHNATARAPPKRAQPSPPARKKRKAEPAPEAPEEQEETEPVLDPQTKKVREWRHKLQRAFLPKDGTVREEDMEAQDATLKLVEAYEQVTPEQLRATKIAKVVKRIPQLPSIPLDDKYHFRERAEALLVRWAAILNAAPTA